jgi:hypothetical protein
MLIAQWWPKLQPQTRDWLIANNGDVIPPTVMTEIAEVGGPATADAWWVTGEVGTGAVMPDEAIDWIEEIANEETPAES